MILFDYIKNTNRLVVNCDDDNIFNQIREHFSVKNDDANKSGFYLEFA